MLNIDERTPIKDASMSKALPKEQLNKVSDREFHTIAELFWSAKKVDQQQIVTTRDKIFKNLETPWKLVEQISTISRPTFTAGVFLDFSFTFINPPQLDGQPKS